ncbi:MAG: M20/M25/M40 family metallo-hydrolase [Acidobacteria bacterium]|nr:M20/M25/M40 family metallo-hydrolase [Acidobacteriota bacterium]
MRLTSRQGIPQLNRCPPVTLRLCQPPTGTLVKDVSGSHTERATLIDWKSAVGAVTAARPDLIQARTIAQTAAEPALIEACQWFAAERRWINEKHLELCRIPAPTFQEQRRAEWMVAQFRSLGCDARVDRAGNVLAHVNGDHGGQMVALTAHLDTVLEPRSPDDIRIGRDGEVTGPGVADNGAGLAALLAVAGALRGNRTLRDSALPLLLVANVGEEGEGNLSGMRFLCRQSGMGSRIASFVVLDGPATDHITCRALASRRFEITCSGPGGHSWSDWGVGNPVHAISRAITFFAEQPVSSGPRTTFNFGLIEGGTSVNSIPASARAKVDLRSESPSRIDEMAAWLTASLERAIEIENDRSTAGRVSAKVREIGSRPGGQVAEDARIVRHIRAVDSHLGIRAHIDCASTDANIPLSLGLPAMSIGAGGQGGGAHTVNEWFRAEGRETGLRRILLLLVQLMRDLDPSAAR